MPQRRRLNPNIWKGTLWKENPRLPWDPANLTQLLEQGTNPRCSLEVVLRCANTVRCCVETAHQNYTNGNNEWMQQVLHRNDLIPVLYYWFQERVEPGASGVRLREHVLMTFLMLLGHETVQDELIVFDPRFLHFIILLPLRDDHSIVVCAAAQLVRRITELDTVAHVIAFEELVLQGILNTLEAYNEDPNISSHIFCALINLAGNTRVHFSFARNTALLHLMTEFLDAAAKVGTYESGVQAAKVVANLLYFPENVPEIKSQMPSLVAALTYCMQVVNEEDERNGTADRLAVELANTATVAIEYFHEKDVEGLERDILKELEKSPADVHSIHNIGHAL